jgi:hypothetical protein
VVEDKLSRANYLPKSFRSLYRKTSDYVIKISFCAKASTLLSHGTSTTPRTRENGLYLPSGGVYAD